LKRRGLKRALVSTAGFAKNGRLFDSDINILRIDITDIETESGTRGRRNTDGKRGHSQKAGKGRGGVNGSSKTKRERFQIFTKPEITDSNLAARNLDRTERIREAESGSIVLPTGLFSGGKVFEED